MKRVENSIADLTQKVVAVLQTSDIAKSSSALMNVIKVLHELKNNSKAKQLPQMRQRSSLASYFAGREEEMEMLKPILDSYGSAAIIQFRGLRKTQLAEPFAEWAERNKWITGGTFWIRSSCSKNQCIDKSIVSGKRSR